MHRSVQCMHDPRGSGALEGCAHGVPQGRFRGCRSGHRVGGLFHRHAEVAAKLQTLWTASHELTARRATLFVDLTSVRFGARAQVRAAAVGIGCKSVETEVSRLDAKGEIGSADAAPAHEIGRRDENAAVLSRSTACATSKTVQRVVLAVFRVVRGFRRGDVRVARYGTSTHEATQGKNVRVTAAIGRVSPLGREPLACVGCQLLASNPLSS